MAEIAIIGGTGFTKLARLDVTRREVVHTPFGEPSAPLTHGLLNGVEVVFLPRHGSGHTLPPHRINYRANLWALRHLGIQSLVSLAAVGGIRKDMRPCRVAVPDQIIDYTWGRKHTFFEQDLTHVTHIDFTEPYCDALRQALIEAGRRAGLDIVGNGVYGATQGPRLETAREIDRLERDGCDIVGMTGMPEAALARELDICYASCAVVANWAAGRGATASITLDEIDRNLKQGMQTASDLLTETMSGLSHG